jgi:hypothetical protein
MLKCNLAVVMFILLLAATTLSAQEADKRAGKAAPALTLSRFNPSGTDDFETVRLPSEKYLKTVKLTLRGTNFNFAQPEQNQILIDDNPQAVKWWGANDPEALPNAAEPNKNEICGKVVSSETIELYRVPVAADGVIKVAVKQGEQRTPDQRFIVYRSWSKLVVGTISAAIAIVLALAVLGLIKLFINSQSKSFAFNPLQVLFLDPETNTYSLSKLQFYCWTVAGLFGYSYLAISKIWVQGLSWPDMPGGLPSIIAIGAGTSVGSQMITNLRGPKGAGNEKPNLGDFVTSGGVAAADRVQMLVWTILGVGIFGLSVLTHQPGSIPGLDPVPDGMLSIMGLSAMGYLGGKFARKPGPVINEISITPAAGDDTVIGTAGAASTGQSQDVLTPGPEAKRFVRYIELRGRNLLRSPSGDRRRTTSVPDASQQGREKGARLGHRRRKGQSHLGSGTETVHRSLATGGTRSATVQKVVRELGRQEEQEIHLDKSRRPKSRDHLHRPSVSQSEQGANRPRDPGGGKVAILK